MSKLLIFIIFITSSTVVFGGLILQQSSSSQPFASGVTLSGPACNAVAFGAHPSLGNIMIGRKLNNTSNDPCSGNNWSLTTLQMNWISKNTFTFLKYAFDTSKGPVNISDGNLIFSAYDPIVEFWNKELWVAFECIPKNSKSASTCIGPLLSDNTIDINRTTLVILGTATSSGSVPKLLSFKGHLYLYWDSSIFDGGKNTGVIARGIELAQETSGLQRLWALNNKGTPIGIHFRSTANEYPALSATP